MEELKVSEEFLSDALMIVALGDEDRSKYAIDQFVVYNGVCKSALIISYSESDKKDTLFGKLQKLVSGNDIKLIDGLTHSQYEFVNQLKECDSIRKTCKIILDISCILTPHIFLLMKCIYMWNKKVQLYVINTIPFDYSFSDLPFLSYRSYYGDLRMEEIIGYSSSKGINYKRDLYIFAGFEGTLALKVEEDTEYNRLYYVNALPSYYQKYKDISIINNYKLLLSKNCNRLYAPAINPFEVYNLLNNHHNSEVDALSVAPLCTKPMALGICMYALEHDNVRIVYPFSDKYELERSHGVHKSYVYTIQF